MRKFDSLITLVEVYFSCEMDMPVGSLDCLLLERRNNDPEWVNQLLDDLNQSLIDPEFSWVDLLWNDECHIYEAGTEDKARIYVRKEILPIFIQSQ